MDATFIIEIGQDWKIAALRFNECVRLFLGEKMEEKYMQLALFEAEKALKNDDVPVGAIIVKNDRIIARGYNKKNKKNNAVLHAEIDVITKACKKIKSWNLNDCEIYITMEPCLMCCGAIVQARISKVIYGSDNYKFGCSQNINMIYDKKMKINNHYLVFKKNVLKNQCDLIIKKFFLTKRKKRAK